MREWWEKLTAGVMLALLLIGCGLFSGPAAPAAFAVTDALAKIVQKALAEKLQDVPTSCIQENHPDQGQLLVLCTVCYKLEAGQTCK